MLGTALRRRGVNRFTRGSGLPIAVPSVELIEIGAGGGSIAWRDALGLLQVGPQSAAADPGPACYALGGEQPTVTDANLLLGYLAPDFFLGGRMRLQQELAVAAVGRLADSLAMDLIACSWGIHQVVNEQMAAAARMHIIERGYDPRRFTLVASGGAGPAHVASVARHLGAQRYVLPAGAGALASFGCLAAPAAFAAERTLIAPLQQPLQQVEWARVRSLFAEMTNEAQIQLAAMGIQPDQIRWDYAVDMRMVGQIHPIQITLTLDELNGEAARAIAERFHERYTLLFARTNRAMPLEFVNWRLLATGNPPALRPAQVPRAASDDPSEAHKGNRSAYFAGKGFLPTPIYDRYALRAGMVIVGPAILEEREIHRSAAPGRPRRGG